MDESFRMLTGCLWTRTGLVITINPVTDFLLEGSHWFLPDDPNRYEFLSDVETLD
jgi:hypothetical protein